MSTARGAGAAGPAASAAGGSGSQAGADTAAGPARYLIRDAVPGDLDAIAGFEIEIARASFGDDAVTDAELHRRRVQGSLGKAGEVMLIAVAAPAGGVGADEAVGSPVGWAWMSGRTNSLTGERYGNFRSLAVADTADRGAIGELLMAAVVAAADAAGLRHVTGKVHASNVGMRTLYRKFGFEATHVTMEKRAPANGPAS
jgi:ribosomal protein S18 acetylase RimI-like enzyme